MKKILSLILIICFSLFLVGCSKSPDKFEDLFKDIKTGAREYIYEYDNKDKNNSLDLLKQVSEFNLDEEDITSTIIMFNTFYDDYIYVSEQQMLALVYSYIFPTNKSVLNELASITDVQLDFTECYSNFLLDIYESDLKEEFFVDFSEDDLAYLEYQKEYFDSEYYELQGELATIEMEYTELLNTEETTETQLANKYIEMVNVNNKIARKLDYNNYLEYAYDSVYQRSYVYEDLEHITDAVQNDLIPNLPSMFNSIQADIEGLGFGALIWQGIFTNNWETCRTHLDGLANYMGGDYLDHYNYLWNNGEYYFGNKYSNEGAFVASITDKQVAYFGPSPYNSLFTVTHEFGHYAAGREDIKDGNKNLLDLAEFQSQANELMLASYMQQKNNSAVYDAVAKYKLFECTTNTIVSSLVNEFEYIVYTSTNLQAGDIARIMNEVVEDFECVVDGFGVIESMFGDLSTIWTQTAAASPGYYISYGMSLYPSLQHFFESNDDLDNAKNKYFDIMSGESDLFEVINNIGYNNPLNDGVVSELFIDIKNYIIN